MPYQTMVCTLALALCLGPHVMQAAEAAASSGAPALSHHREYRVGANDLLALKIFGVEDLDQVVRVSSSGLISVPYLGRVFVAGLTGAEIEEKIQQELTAKELVRDPQVSVFIQEYNSQPIYVLGAVNQPGQYMMTHALSVIDAITMAGGLDRKQAGKYILVRRGKGLADSAAPEGDRDDPPVFRIDSKVLLEDGDTSQDVPLRGGDVVQVPIRTPEVFYVIGDVIQPGAFEFPPNTANELLASRAVGWAGGPSRTAKLKDTVVLRYSDGQRQEIPFDLRAVLQDNAADLTIQPNDIIYVPGSKSKTLGWGLLGILPGTMSGVAIWNSNR